MKNVRKVNLKLTKVLFSSIIYFVALFIGITEVTAQEMQSSSNGFIPNKGQLAYEEQEPAEDILFYSNSGLNTSFKADGFQYALHRFPQIDPESGEELKEEGVAYGSHGIGITFEGANANPIIYAKEKLSHYFNFFYGHCPQGITNVHPYREIVYQNVWDKIDVVFKEKGGGIEYDFIVHPGGDPNDIALHYSGVNITLDEIQLPAAPNTTQQGLTMHSPLGNITEHIPLIHQEGTPIAGNYSLTQIGELEYVVHFEIEDYDPALALVVDPWAFIYTTGANNTSSGETSDVSELINGDYIVSGAVGPFIPIKNAFQSAYGGGYNDVFLSRLTNDGAVVWSTYYGGNAIDKCYDHEIKNEKDEIVLVGNTNSMDFPMPSGYPTLLNEYKPGYRNAINPALSSTENYLLGFTFAGIPIWGGFYGGNGDPSKTHAGASTEGAAKVIQDIYGNLIFGGISTSFDYPVQGGVLMNQNSGGPTGSNQDAVLTKVDSDGDIIWSGYFGSSDKDVLFDLAINGKGDIAILISSNGNQIAKDSILVLPDYQPSTIDGNFYDLLLVIDSNGAQKWGTYIDQHNSEVYAVEAFEDDGWLVGGTVRNTTNFQTTSNVFRTTKEGKYYDAFLMTLTKDGKKNWATYVWGDEAAVYPTGLYYDSTRKVILFNGYTNSPNFPTTNHAIKKTYTSTEGESYPDFYFGIMDNNGSKLLCASYYGGLENEGAIDIGLGLPVPYFWHALNFKTDRDGDIFLLGATSSDDFPIIRKEGDNTFSSGGDNAFADPIIVKLCPTCNCESPPIELGPEVAISCQGVEVDFCVTVDTVSLDSTFMTFYNEGYMRTGWLLGTAPLPWSSGSEIDWFNDNIDPLVGPGSVPWVTALDTSFTANGELKICYRADIPDVMTGATLTYALGFGSCLYVDTVQIEVIDELPEPNVLGLKDICTGDSLLMYGESTVSPVDFEWFKSLPSNQVELLSNEDSFQTGPLDSDTSFFLGVTRNICTSELDTHRIDIFPLAVMKFDVDGRTVNNNTVSICQGDEITMRDTASIAQKSFFEWKDQTGNVLGSTEVLTMTPTETTTYYLTTIENGCVNTDSIKINFFNNPVVGIISDTALCMNESASIGKTPIPDNGYNWSSTPLGFTSTDANPTVMPTATTTYHLTQTNTITGCQNTDEVTVTINPLPEPNTGADIAICDGESTTIGSALVAGNTYSWTSSPAGFTSTDAIVEVSPTITTTYTLTQILDATGCEKTDQITVTIKSLPVANAGNNALVCGNAIVTLGSTPIGGNLYSWTPVAQLNDASLAQPSFTAVKQSAGRFIDTLYLTVTGANGCANFDSVEITSLPNPLADAGTDQDIQCEANTNLLASASGGEGAFTYSWKQVGGSTGPNTAAWNNVGAGTYAITVFDQNLCFDRDTTVVSLAAGNLTATPSANPGTICDGEQTTLTVLVSNQQGAPTITWTSPDTTFSGTGPHFMEPNATTTYNVNVSDDAGCEVDVPLTVTVNPTPIPVLSSANLVAQGICANEELVFTVSPSDLTNYKFTLDGNEVQNGASNMYTASTSTPVNYNLEVTVVNSFGCQASTSLNYTVFELPTVDLGEDLTVVCEQTRTLVATPSGGEGTYSYSWLDENITELSTTNTLSDVGAGTYTLNIEDGNECMASDELTITNTGNPMTLSLNASPADICVGEESTITAILNGENGGRTYIWNEALTGTGPHTVGPSTTTTYTLQVSDDFGCEANAEVELIVNELPTITISTNSGDNIFCVGEQMQLIVSPTDLLSYDFSLNGSPTTTGVTGNTLTRSDLTANTYNFSVIGSNGCESGASISISVDNAPPLETTVELINICYGEPATLEVNSPSGTITYSWSEKGGATVGTGASVMVSPTETTTYEVTATDNTSECTTTKEVEVEVTPLPIASFNYNVAGFELSTSASIANGITNWTWEFGDRTSRIFGTATTTHIYTQLGTYNLLLIVESDCGLDTMECAVVIDGSTYIGTNCESMDVGVELHEDVSGINVNIYPNPFKKITNVELIVENAGDYSLLVYDVQGRLLQTPMHEKTLSPGTYIINYEEQHAQGMRLFMIKRDNQVLKVMPVVGQE